MLSSAAAHSRLWQGLSSKEEKRAQVHAPNQEAPAADSAYKEELCFPNGASQGITTILQATPYPAVDSNTKGTQWMRFLWTFCLKLLSLGILFYLGLLLVYFGSYFRAGGCLFWCVHVCTHKRECVFLVVFLVCLFFKERKKGREVRLSGKKVWSEHIVW